MSVAGNSRIGSLSKAAKNSYVQRAVRFFFQRAFFRDCAALSVILFLTLAYFVHDILDGQVYFEPDTTSFYYPLMSAVDGAIKQFSIPLWTPYIFGGFPLFADGEAGMLYPPNLILMWFLTPQQVLVWGRVIRFFLAGSFMYAYSRSLSISRTGSLLSGLVFAFGSFMVGQLHHTNVGNSAIWLPLILFFVELGFQSFGSRRILFLLLAGVSLGIQNLGIHIQPVLLTLFAFFFYVAFRAVLADNPAVGSSLKARLKLALIAWITVPAVGLSFAAVQLLPLYGLGTFSFRGGGVSYAFATTYSLPVQNLITLVFPYFFERTDGSTWSLWVEWESTVYAGIFPLLLAVLAIVRARHRLVGFYTSLALVSILLAFGDYLPVKLYWLIWQVPGFSSLRAPGRFSYLFIFSIAVLAAFGLDWLTRAMRISRAWEVVARCGPCKWVMWLIGGALGGCVLTLSGIVLLRTLIIDNRAAVFGFIQGNYLVMRGQSQNMSADAIYNALVGTLDFAKFTTVQPIILLALLAVLLIAWHRLPSRAIIWRSLLVVFVATDLLLFAWRFHPTTTLDSVSNPSGPVRFLIQENGLHRVYNRYTGLRSEPNRLLPFKVATAGGYSSLEVERIKNFMRAIDKGNTKLLDLWNVRYVVGKASQQPFNSALPVVFQEGDVAIFENKSYLPRAFVTDSFVVASSSEGVLEEMQNSAFDPASIVVLEEEPEEPSLALDNTGYSVATAGRQMAVPPARKGVVDVVDYKREDILLKADTGKGSFLVLTDSFYPGWKAFVDGREVKIYRADYLFRAIYLPPGFHTVEFVFQPLDFELGRNISVASIIATAIACIVLLYRSRREALAGPVGPSSGTLVAQ